MGKSSKARRSRREITDLDGLRQVVRRIDQEQAHEAELARAAFEIENRQVIERARERQLLDDALSDVTPLQSTDRITHRPTRPDPTPRQREQDEQAALRASLSDDIGIEQYLETDEQLSYRADGIGPEVVPRLRRGTWRICAQLDLHGLRRDEARETLVAFLDDCRRHNHRCVRIIHGKGLGSVNREPVLKGKVRKWLVQRSDVLAFCQARPNDGGSGALLVLLAGSTRS